MAGVQIDGVNNKIDFDDDQDTSISANTDDTLVIEAGGNTLATFTATTLTINDGTTITTADNSDNLTLKSTDTDADVGPNLRLYRAVTGAASDAIGTIDWAAQDAGGGLTDYASAAVTITDATDGNEDGTLTFKVMNAGSLNQMLTISGPETVVNEGSKDHDFRVESNGKTHALFVDGGNNRVGFITAPDLGNVHIRVDDTGASSSNDADELVLEKNGACGLSILSGNSSAGNIFFGDDGDNDKGFIAYGHAVDDMFFSVNGNGGVYALVLHDSNAISTSGETAPDVNEGGITLDQNANDGNIITFKSSDIAHGITGTAETDTYATFKKHSATNGGIAIVALSEATETIKLNANPTSVDTTKSTSGVGTHIIAVSKNGNAAAGTDANLLVVNNAVK